MSAPFVVSVVTPVLNAVEFIEDTVESVLGQQGILLDYIIADGGSTDGTLSKLRKYEGLARVLHGPDRGQSHAINRGLTLARGQYFAWLNADDVYTSPYSLQRMAAEMERSSADVVYGDVIVEIAPCKDLVYYRPLPAWGVRLLHGYNFVPQACTLIRTDAMRRIGGLNDDLHYSMDYELWLRLRKNRKFAYYPVEVARIRLHPGAKTIRQKESMKAESALVQRRFRGRFLPTPIIKSAVVAMMYLRNGRLLSTRLGMPIVHKAARM